jgi:hypothetical protein
VPSFVCILYLYLLLVNKKSCNTTEKGLRYQQSYSINNLQGDHTMAVAKKEDANTTSVKPKAKPAPVLYISKSLRMFHPDQQKYLLPGEPVELEMDPWLEAQVGAGLVTVQGS